MKTSQLLTIVGQWQSHYKAGEGAAQTESEGKCDLNLSQASLTRRHKPIWLHKETFSVAASLTSLSQRKRAFLGAGRHFAFGALYPKQQFFQQALCVSFSLPILISFHIDFFMFPAQQHVQNRSSCLVTMEPQGLVVFKNCRRKISSFVIFMLSWILSYNLLRIFVKIQLSPLLVLVGSCSNSQLRHFRQWREKPTSTDSKMILSICQDGDVDFKAGAFHLPHCGRSACLEIRP